MRKTILEIYALAVCFVTVVCLVIALGIGLYSVVQMINPNFTMSAWDYERHQSNDVFWLPNKYCSEEKKNQERPAEAELTRQREESFTRKLASEGRDGVQTFVKSLIVIFIDLVIFFIHWTIGQKARHNATA